MQKSHHILQHIVQNKLITELFMKVAWPFNFLSYWLNWPYCSVTSLIGRYQCYRLVIILVQDYKCQVICKETNWINQKIQSASSFVLFIFLYYWRCVLRCIHHEKGHWNVTIWTSIVYLSYVFGKWQCEILQSIESVWT